MRSIPLSLTLLVLAGGAASAGQVGQDIRYVTVRDRRGPRQAERQAGVLRHEPPHEGDARRGHGRGAGRLARDQGRRKARSATSTRSSSSNPVPSTNIRVVTIEGAPVPVFVGSEVLAQPADGHRRAAWSGAPSSSAWACRSTNRTAPPTCRIRPPDRERRYVRAAFVSKTPPDGFAHSTFSPTGGKLVASTAPSANPGSSPGDLVRRAPRPRPPARRRRRSSSTPRRRPRP